MKVYEGKLDISEKSLSLPSFIPLSLRSPSHLTSPPSSLALSPPSLSPLVPPPLSLSAPFAPLPSPFLLHSLLLPSLPSLLSLTSHSLHAPPLPLAPIKPWWGAWTAKRVAVVISNPRVQTQFVDCTKVRRRFCVHLVNYGNVESELNQKPAAAFGARDLSKDLWFSKSSSRRQRYWLMHQRFMGQPWSVVLCKDAAQRHLQGSCCVASVVLTASSLASHSRRNE